jgi:hypothetical protein
MEKNGLESSKLTFDLIASSIGVMEAAIVDKSRRAPVTVLKNMKSKA